MTKLSELNQLLISSGFREEVTGNIWKFIDSGESHQPEGKAFSGTLNIGGSPYSKYSIIADTNSQDAPHYYLLLDSEGASRALLGEYPIEIIEYTERRIVLHTSRQQVVLIKV